MSAAAPPAISDRTDRLLVLVLTVVVCLGTLAATLTPATDWDGAKKRVFCVLCDRGSETDALANVFLFVPLGFALSLAAIRGTRTLAAAAVLSLLIEAAQVFVPGRDQNVGDVLFNVTGAVLGWLLPQRTAAGQALATGLVHGMRRLVFPSQRLQPWLSLGSASVVTAVLALTSWLLTPDFPAGPYFAGSSSLDSTGGPLYLGGNPRERDFLRACIDEVRIFNRPRNPAEIRADMNRPVGGRADDAAVASDLVAAYDFEPNAAGIVNDVSGRGHHGFASGAVPVQGRFGRGLKLAGRPEDVVTIAPSDVLNLSSGLTVEAWVNPTSPQPDWGNIVQKDNDAYFLTASSDAGQLQPAGGGSFGGLLDSVKSVRPIPVGVWSHLAITYDGATLVLYVNGEPTITRQRWSTARLFEASVGTVKIDPGRIERSAELRTQLTQGAPLRLRFTPVSLQDTLVPVVRIRDQQEDEVLFLGTESGNIVLRSRVVAARHGLGVPAIRVHGAQLGYEPGRPVTVTVSRMQASYCLELGAQTTCGVGFGIASGWVFLVNPLTVPRWLEPYFNFVWLGLLFFASGFCTYRRRTTYPAMILLLMALLVLPRVSGVPTTPLALTMSALLALVAGWYGRLVLQYTARRTC